MRPLKAFGVFFPLRRNTPGMQRSSYAIPMVADAMVPVAPLAKMV